MKYIFICFLFVCTFLFSETYTRSYDPSNDDAISYSSFWSEFDVISAKLNIIESSNISNASIANVDFANNAVTAAKILNGTLTPADFANLGTITTGGMIYGTASATLGVLATGSNDEVLTLASGIPDWAAAPSQPFTDSGGVLYCQEDDNLVLGGSSVGTDGKAVMALYENTIPSDGPANAIQLYAEDVQDSTTKLLLNFNGTDGAQTTTDESASSHSVTFYGSAQIDDSSYKWTSSCLFDGSGDYLSIPDSSDWDVFADNSDDWTIDFWVKHISLSGTNSYVNHGTDLYNFWELRCEFGVEGLSLRVSSGGSKLIEVISSYDIPDTNWHHIALCKVGSEYGIYYDGVQKAYTNDSSTLNKTNTLYIAGRGSSNNLAGRMDSLRIIEDNIFSAAPNSGKTDTITAPTVEPSVSSGTELKVRDEADNITVLSPHNLGLIPSNILKDYFSPWSFYSTNKLLGKTICVDMYGVMKAIEELSGKQYLYEREISQE